MNKISKPSSERLGEISIMSSAILWSLFPVITILSYNGLDPITSLAWATFFSMLFFLAIAIARSSWINIFRRDILLSLLAVALIQGIFFYILYFTGLTSTSAGNASIIATSEILFTFLFFNIWRKEYIDIKHIAGAIFMIISAITILSPNFIEFRPGDFFILGAMAIAPVGNMFQKRLRKNMNSEQLLFFRTLIATPALFIIAYAFGENVAIPTGNIWWILLINGLILFGLTKILWIESIHRISVTKAISMGSVSPIFTLFFAFLILGDHPTTIQIVALPISILGIYLLTRPMQKT
jgi:drug/metabolite transporter (DMT)-like permease